jgi:hypothetical protein
MNARERLRDKGKSPIPIAASQAKNMVIRITGTTARIRISPGGSCSTEY